MPNSENPFENYVEHRLASMAMAAEMDREDSFKQGVTIRLNTSLIGLSNALATAMGETRQALLLEIISTGLHQIARAYADSHGDRAQEVYRQLMDAKDTKAGDI